MLSKKIDGEPLYSIGSLLYHIPINEYKKQLLKGNVDLMSGNNLPSYCMFYTRDILKSRFEPAEEIISKEAYCSYHYALHVVKGRFELGEKAINAHPYYGRLYREAVIDQLTSDNTVVCMFTSKKSYNLTADTKQ